MGAWPLECVGSGVLPAGSVVDPQNPLAALEGRKGAELRVLSADDGEKLAGYHLDSPPVFDGMAAAGGKIYLTLADGSVRCFAGR